MDSSLNDVAGIETGSNTSDRSTFVKEHDDSLDETSLEILTFGFTEKSWKTDFVLIVEGTRLYVNKAILALVSPVFDTMFQSDFKESSCDELDLPGKRLNDVVDFLRCIYPKDSAHLTQEGALNVLPLIEEYQVLHLKSRCETLLLEHINEETPVEELFRILQVACLYNLVNLRKQCVKTACNKSQEDIDEALENNPPPAETAQEIIEELNKKLREINCEQKSLVCRASTSNKVLKTKISEREVQLDILKQNMWSDVRENKIFKFDDDITWKKYADIFDVDMAKEGTVQEKEVCIWNVPLVIRILLPDTMYNPRYLKIEIKTTRYKVTAKLKGRTIIVNRQPIGKNEHILFDGLLTSGHGCVQKNLISLSSINNIDQGFLLDGHIGIIVQLYMSEPNIG